MWQVLEFLKEAKAELYKVSWPTRKELIRHTVVVVGISFFAAVFLGTLDSLFSVLAQRFLFQ
jgi:preprotein translocase subunit SecE